MYVQEIAITADGGGKFSAYLAAPDTGVHPGIIVIQEIFGVNEDMRQIARGYAEAGYVAIVPDLFWRQEPNVQLDPASQADWDKAFALYEGFSEDQGVADLVATLRTLRDLPNCTGKIGSVGFCLGGKLAFLMATRSAANCNVSYYGVGIENQFDEIDWIEKPLILHMAEGDEYVPTQTQAIIKQELSGKDLVTVYSYPQVDHGFARADSQQYDRAAAELANSRTMEFFGQHLQ
ncbi:MAG: dienelactone hydrolase family protein [Hormoscilla sp.]